MIDPHTGMLLKRVTTPRDNVTSNRPSDDHSFQAAITADSAWNNPSSVLADDGTAATFSGSERNWLFLKDPSLNYGDYGLETLTFSMKAWCSGSCAADDGKVQACLTVNGVS